MTVKVLVVGGLASLIAVPAFAQRTYPPHVDMPVAAQTGKADIPTTPGAIAQQPSAAEANAVTYPSVAVPQGNKSPYLSDNVSGPTSTAEIVKSQPAPDTPASRSLYPPLSRAGKRTAAAGD